MGTVRKRQNKKGTVYYLDFSVDGKRHRETIGPSKAEAEIILRDIEEDLRKRRFPVLDVSKPRRVHFSEIAEDFLEYARVNKKPSGYQRDLISIQHFKNFFGNIQIVKITLDLIKICGYELSKLWFRSCHQIHTV